MGENVFRTLSEKYPFITLCRYAGLEYVGVIQNRDESVTSIYDFGDIQDSQDKRRFLDLAGIWWWESNRTIPINIFLREEWTPYRTLLRTFTNRDLVILHGPICSLNDIVRRKTKRRSIQLVRRVL